MTDVYRKQGTVMRWDNGLLVRVDETGEAVEDGDLFRCRPVEPAEALSPVDGSAIENVVRDIRVAAGEVVIERLLVSEGIARHEIAGRRWNEQARRVHLSLVHPSTRLRAMLDMAGFRVEGIAAVADALSRAQEVHHDLRHLRLAENVTAAILPSMVRHRPAGVRLIQTGGGRDGRGEKVGESELTAEPWPNWYRPSYRVRPVRAPLNIRAECAQTVIDESLPRAIALLAPPIGRELRLLCVDSSRAFTTTIRIRRVRATGPPIEWFPYGAGSWGSEMEVE